MEKTSPKIDFAVGGQALIEGVMMRSPHFITVSVRKKDGSIKAKTEKFNSLTTKMWLLGIPLVRGVVNLFEMMIVGMKMLNFSSNEALADEEPETTKTEIEEKTKKENNWMALGISLVFSLVMSIFLFKFLPLSITDFLSSRFAALKENYMLYNLIDGFIKMLFFIVYIALLGTIPQLKRVFQYHGAEHKSIYTYEQGLDLTVENARKMTRFHPRCGTSFILVVFMISIFVYTFVPRQEAFWLNFALRVAFLPIIAGISYELLKWSAKYSENPFVRIIAFPGLMFQRVTTKEPDDQQLEVALNSLKEALVLEEERLGAKLQPSPQMVA